MFRKIINSYLKKNNISILGLSKTAKIRYDALYKFLNGKANLNSLNLEKIYNTLNLFEPNKINVKIITNNNPILKLIFEDIINDINDINYNKYGYFIIGKILQDYNLQLEFERNNNYYYFKFLGRDTIIITLKKIQDESNIS